LPLLGQLLGVLTEVHRGISDSVITNDYHKISSNIAMSLYFLFILPRPFGLHTSYFNNCNIFFLFLSDVIFDILIFVQFNNTISSKEKTRNVVRAMRI
jgi:hypothetical protein